MTQEYDEQKDLKQQGIVFNIQKYSVHDGPGIRTLVFLKGCSLSCRWCSNPESQNKAPELAYNAGRCLEIGKCGHCVTACPRGAISKGENDKPVINRSLCDKDCDMSCSRACPAQALNVYGKISTVAQVLSKVEQDAAFYCRSGGGMTLSGGEPLLQSNFVIPLLRQARVRRLKTAVETCGMVPSDTIRFAAPYLTNVLFDIKHMDSEKHALYTGSHNEHILKNFRIFVEEFPDMPILARTPIIPGFNDNTESVSAIAEFLQPFKRVRFELLPYHRLGTQKYHFLHREPPMGDVTLDKSIMPLLQQAAIDILGERVLHYS